MNLSQIHLSDIQVFLAVSRYRSLVAASRKLRINHSTAFRWLKRFEDQIGHKLFEINNHDYVLSETGHKVFPIAEKIANDVTSLSLVADSLDSELIGEVKIASADALVLKYLAPKINLFYEKYPGITIHLTSDNQFVNLSKREADIAIRPTFKPAENMIGRKAASMVFGLYASHDYVAQYGDLNVENKGEGHIICDYDESLSHLKAAKWIKDNLPQADIAIKLSSTVALTEFAVAGIGIAAIPCFIGDNEPQLTKLINFDNNIASDIWLLTHPDLRHSPKIRAVLDFMFDEIRNDEAIFLG